MRRPARLLLALALLAAGPARAELANDPEWNAGRAAPIIAAWCAERVPGNAYARQQCQTAQISAGNALSMLARRHREGTLENRFILDCRQRSKQDYTVAYGCASRRLKALNGLYTTESRGRIGRLCKARFRNNGVSQSMCELEQTGAIVSLAEALGDAPENSPATLLIRSCIGIAHGDFLTAARCAIPEAPRAAATGTAPAFGAPLTSR